VIRALIYVLLLLLVVAGATAYAYPKLVRSSLIGFTDFRAIGDKLYVSPSIATDEEESIKSLFAEARTRIGFHFGPPTASPTIIVIDTDAQAENYGLGGAPGSMVITPWGNYVLLHIRKGGLDVAAHELVHAEIAERLGYLNRMRKFPTWLDEGIALQVDYRSEYSELFDVDEQELARVTALHSPKTFWTSDRDLTIQNYRSSKAAVNMTFFKKGTQSALYSLLARINEGEDVSRLIGVR